VNCIGTAVEGRLQNPLRDQIALQSWRSANLASLIGQADMKRLSVDLGEYGNRSNTQLTGGANNTAGDLTAIGNQNLVEHHIIL